MNTIDASKGQWGKIYDYFGLPPITGGKHYSGPCPLCGKKNHFRIDDRSEDGDWICTCGSGKGLMLIQEVFQVSFQDACEMVNDVIDNHNVPVYNPFYKTREQQAQEEFDKCLNVKGTDAENYFKNRGIHILPNSKAVKYCNSYKYDHVRNLSFPCIKAKVISPLGAYSYTHLTFIVGGNKIQLEPQRKMISVATESRAAFIRLFDHQEVLGIAEGIESAMSAMQIYDIPTWSTLNTGLMKKFVCPKGVRTFVIFADNDDNLSGQAAAYECARRNMLANNTLETIVIMWPEIIGNDFNDSLMNKTFNTVNHKYKKS